MGKQLHKRFRTEEVKNILEQFIIKEISEAQCLGILQIKRRRFFELLAQYRENPEQFSIEYKRAFANHRLDKKAEEKILRELRREKKMIESNNNPVRDYNYSFIREILAEKHNVHVSLPTVIRRAKKMGFIKKNENGGDMTGKF